jgi:peptidoglycan hydrolase-like protein with peptidoglycan-binding domain
VERRRPWLALLAAASVAPGCRHTRHVDEPSGEQGGEKPAAKQEQGASGQATRERVPPRAGRPAVAATPEGLMNPGSARRIQEALRARGLLTGEPSGELDEATSAALRRFQRTQQLAQTGAPDRETLRRLGVDPQDIYRTVPKGAEAEPSR